MRCYGIGPFVLFTVLLNCHSSLGQRPAWASTIMGNGRNDNKFNHIKNQIIQRSTANLQPNDLHLAHVFPWAAIDRCVNTSWARVNQNRLSNLVRRIYEVDTEAVAPEKWTNKRSRTGDLIPDPTKIPLHSTYLGRSLRAINTIQRTGALQTACRSGGSITQKDNCKTLLYNAPANLRYGLGSPNMVISDRLDLMGNRKGRITRKEHALIDIFTNCYQDFDAWCISKTEYCRSSNAGFAIRSSSAYTNNENFVH